MPRDSEFETIWEFNTAQFRVEFAAAPEDDMDLSWDDTGETREGLESGLYCCFVARVRVLHVPTDDTVLGTAYLGQCIYENPSDFVRHGGYFDDMVSEAIREARKYRATLAEMPKLRAA